MFIYNRPLVRMAHPLVFFLSVLISVVRCALFVPQPPSFVKGINLSQRVRVGGGTTTPP